MAVSAKRRFAGAFVLLMMMTLVGGCMAYYALFSEVEISFVERADAADAQEATRKLKLLTDAQNAKRNGFVRLTEAEINAMLHARQPKAKKNRTDGEVHLVKAGVLLHESDITFVTWHSLSFFGVDLPLVWQRKLALEKTTNGWSLDLRGMRVGKVTVPDQFWPDVKAFLGGNDNAFDEQKTWLASLPTLMLSRNEISQKPELRLYTYIPVVKEPTEALTLSQAPRALISDKTNTLTAKVEL